MKGSSWHRWDLHYHTPSSYDYKKENKTNQELVDELIADGVDAVVVTDHHRIDFERIKELNKIADGAIIFLRGIEITSELGGNESVHFIAIFPDTLLEDEIRDSFLAPLGITEEKTSRDSKLYYKAIPYDQFLKHAHSVGALTSIHAGKKNNSIENIKNWCKTKEDFKQSILERIHILETGNKEDFSGYKNIVFKDIGKTMPIVVCSDYHSEYGYRFYADNSTNPATIKQRAATWIKSDLTFEGLKQIIFEPELRVKVQETNPSSSKFGLKLQNLKISKTKLFNEQEITFNEDMIAIIGEKGSGKTALLDMASYILGAKLDDPSSFIQRAKNELKNSLITFNMYGDSIKTVSFTEGSAVCRCQYINPSKLSSFCEDETAMQDFIKSIIINEEIARYTGEIEQRNLDIQSNILKIITLDNQILLKEELQKSIAEVSEKIKIEEKNRPTLPSKDESLLKEFSELSAKIDTYIKDLETLSEKHKNAVWFNSQKDDILNEAAETIRQQLFNYVSSSIEYNDFQIKLELTPITISRLQESENRLNEEKVKIEEKLKSEGERYEKLKTDVFKNQELQERFEKWQKYISELKANLKILKKREQEILLLEGERKQLFEQCIDDYCKNISVKKSIFKYYSDLKDELSKQIGSVEKNKISFSPTTKINTQMLFSKLESVLSLKSVNEETLRANILSKYQKQIEKIFSSDEDCSSLVTSLIELFISPNQKKNLFNKSIETKIFKSGHNIGDLYKIAFSDFFDINYNISFNSIPMDQLSSGQKGIVLLKLLLRLDNSTDPLLIDQPEDNLDNKSVYDQLVEEFKIIKQKRQLLIATHNPNLVINTDAEQIIVAEYHRGAKDGYINYSYGSIENPEIREKICKILEGGRDAFISREKRYNFSNKK